MKSYIVHLCKRIDPYITDKKVIDYVILGIKLDICNELIKMENSILKFLNGNLYKIETQRLIEAKKTEEVYQKINKPINTLTFQPKIVTYEGAARVRSKSEIVDLKESLSSLKIASNGIGYGRDNHSSQNKVTFLRSKSPNRNDVFPYHRNDETGVRFRHQTISQETLPLKIETAPSTNSNYKHSFASKSQN